MLLYRAVNWVCPTKSTQLMLAFQYKFNNYLWPFSFGDIPTRLSGVTHRSIRILTKTLIMVLQRQNQ
jgi:hypothetical protein